MSRLRHRAAHAALQLLPLLLVLGAAPASETEQAALRLSHRVTDPEGNAIPDATVRYIVDGLSVWERDRHVDDWLDPELSSTNETGEVSRQVADGSGSFTVRIEAPGWAPRTLHDQQPGQAETTIQLDRGRRIAGHVVDSSGGKPVARARLTICDREAATFGRDACREAYADETGLFVLDALSQDELRIGAVATGRAASPLDRIAPGEEDLGGIVIRLSPGASLAGTVVDHRGDPVEGARMRFLPEGRRVSDPRSVQSSWPVFTDADGRFEHEGLSSGKSYEVRSIRADRPDATAGPIPIATGRNVKDVEIVMPAAARLVWRLAGPEGETIEDLELYLQEMEEGAALGVLSRPLSNEWIRQSEDGAWSVGPLRRGRFELLIVPSGFAELRKSSVVLRAGETTDLGRLVAEPGREVAGLITDPEGKSVENARVQAWDGGPVSTTSRWAESDPQGQYSVKGLRDGEVTLHVEAEGYFASNHAVPADETHFDVELEPAAGFRGMVLLEEDEVPDGFSILVYAEAESATEGGAVGLTRQQGFATPDGSYRIDNITPGTYTIEARAPDWAPARRSGVVAKPGETTEIDPIILEPGRKLEGRVVAAEDALPVRGVTLELRAPRGWLRGSDESPYATAVSDEDGLFTLRGLVPGEYALRAHHFAFAMAELDLAVTDGASAEEIVVQLSRGGSLSGTVRDRFGSPSPHRTIVLGKTLTDPEARQARTDAGGVYRFDRVTPGTYEARLTPADGQGFRISTVAVVIHENDLTTQDFEDTSGIRLQGQILRSGEPLPRALLFFNPLETVLDLSEMQIATSDDDGFYQIVLDRPGTYRVMVQTDSSGGSSTQIRVPDEPEVVRDIVLELEGISGRVLDDDDAPVPGASVSARREGGTVQALDDLLVAESATDGRYSIQGLEAGTYRVTAVAPGYRIGVAYPVELSGAAVDGIDLRLERGEDLRGVVVDPQGRGIIGAYVLAAPAGAGDPLNAASAETDINGTFRMTAPAEGLLDLTALAPGWAPVHRVSIDPASGAEVVLQVDRGGSLDLRVVDASGSPRSGVYLSVLPVPAYVGSDLGRLLRPVPPTDSDGRTRSANLAPGTYAILILGHPDLPPTSATVQSGNATALTLRIP